MSFGSAKIEATELETISKLILAATFRPIELIFNWAVDKLSSSFFFLIR